MIRAGATVAAVGIGALIAAAAIAATPAGDVALTDAEGDVAANALDAVAARFGIGADGRLRAVVTMAAAWDSSALLASGGKAPGSICVRLYSKADPTAAAPERLACATVAADGKALRGELLREHAHALPTVIGAATVTRPTQRSITIRFARSSIGAAKTVRFAVDVRRPGCVRSSCVDSVPDAPKTARYPAPQDAKD
jgi:hypothetical protein